LAQASGFEARWRRYVTKAGLAEAARKLVTMTVITGNRNRILIKGLIVICCVCALVTIASAQTAFRSALDRPDRTPPPLLTVGPTLGGTPDWQPFRYGASASILFHPESAAHLVSALYDWNTALVLQWEFRDIDRGRSLQAADAVLRYYFGDLTRANGGATLFAGLGGGIALINYPPAAPVSDDGEEDTGATAKSETGEDKYYSFTLEFGYERDLSASAVLLWKMQWRNYIWSGRDYSNYTVHVQLGFPLPW
jgi:hypothetical protein